MGLKFLEPDPRVPYIAETLETYKRAGLALTRDLYRKGTRPALLVIDLQEAFTSPESPIGTKGVSEEVAQIVNSVVENTGVLLDAMRKKGFPVIYVTSIHRKDGGDGGRIGERNGMLMEMCKEGSRFAEIDKRIPPCDSDFIVRKLTSTGFIGTPLLQILTAKRVDTCIIAGVSTSACVRENTTDAVQHGYYAVLPEECVGDRGIGPGKASLFDIWTKFADVAPLEEVLSWINSLN